ncbi:DUF6922 domain-containing protein [Flavobacterium lipolyticum]|uniref:DUF6922 domain-containing protein n=1 Tax=Flavobacterium lipolyticum TaxID=2893754 RepID=A0ABS8M8I3_9FLAO|nr:hypothetical protein [Flavobacterium sp. F-126]MCC9020451.1 hypothetical protein [Flavobacterium sp. F-126]
MAGVKKNNKVLNLNRVFFWDFDIDTMDFEKAYKTTITRIIERGKQEEIDEIVRFYGIEKVIKTIRDEIYFLPNYAIDRAKILPRTQKRRNVLLPEP